MAADATRRLAARNLNAGGSSRRFTEALQTLHADDRLLIRDCQRFHRTQSKKPVTRRELLTQVSRVRLAAGVDWQQTAFDGKYIYAAGFESEGICLARWNPRNTRSTPDYLRWYVPEGLDAPLLMAASENQPGSVMLHLVTTELRKDFTHKSSEFGKTIRNAPAPDAIGLTLSKDNRVWLARRVVFGEAVLQVVDPDGVFGPETDPFCRPASDDLPVRLETHGLGYICAINDGTLYVFRGSELVRSIPLHSPLHGLSSSRSVTPMVAISLPNGGKLLDLASDFEAAFGHGLNTPVTCFTPQDDLIAADRSGIIEIYRRTSKGVDLQKAITPYARSVVGIQSIHTGQIAVCYSDGTLDVFHLNRI